MWSAASRVLLARHGETEWNRIGRRHGQLDSPLTERGRQHAQAIARLCGELDADAVFSSPLGRARATAEIVAGSLSLPVVVVDDLAEIDHGVFAGLTNEEIEEHHPGTLARRANSKYTWSFPDGESYADADQRAASALGTIATSDATSPVVVAHEMIGRLLLRSLLRLDTAEALGRSLPHGSVVEAHPAHARAVTHPT
ncbi:MAG: histidine phosphatase family protein [Ilumatobacteraceae bacterium]|nr:histidine phosphatase family protein [Ilumatobacteraceae bacterium]